MAPSSCAPPRKASDKCGLFSRQCEERGYGPKMKRIEWCSVSSGRERSNASAAGFPSLAEACLAARDAGGSSSSAIPGCKSGLGSRVGYQHRRRHVRRLRMSCGRFRQLSTCSEAPATLTASRTSRKARATNDRTCFLPAARLLFLAELARRKQEQVQEQRACVYMPLLFLLFFPPLSSSPPLLLSTSHPSTLHQHILQPFHKAHHHPHAASITHHRTSPHHRKHPTARCLHQRQSLLPRQQQRQHRSQRQPPRHHKLPTQQPKDRPPQHLKVPRPAPPPPNNLTNGPVESDSSAPNSPPTSRRTSTPKTRKPNAAAASPAAASSEPSH